MVCKASWWFHHTSLTAQKLLVKINQLDNLSFPNVARSEVFIAGLEKIPVLWVMMPFRLVYSYQNSRAAFYIHLRCKKEVIHELFNDIIGNSEDIWQQITGYDDCVW
jgi:hypothetical protein